MSWFQNLFGFRESTGNHDAMQQTRKNFTYDRTTGQLTSNADTSRVFVAGRFETPSVRELRQKVNLDEARSKMPGKLKISEVVSDVSQLHLLPENKFALFQAASQFNCLEFPSQSGRPEGGITCYSGDHTQGPACAIACAPGTVVRNYFGLDGDCQTASRQVENLSDVEELIDNDNEKYLRVVAGYTMSSNAHLNRLNQKLADAKLVEQCRDSLRIGFQWDTEVTGANFGSMEYRGPQQLVTQAYCSACSVSYSDGSSDSWRPFACIVLDASYEATMYGAVLNALNHGGEDGSKRVYLTAVGGGVFGNEVEWIAQAMERAFKLVEGIDLEVVIVSYGRPTRGFARLLSSS